MARQYSGTAGRIENCQIGVFLAYAAPRGCAFLDRTLYLPEEWVGDDDRRLAAGIPATMTAATKSDLAQVMLARAFAAAVPAWVVGDTVYGGGDLRRWLEGQGRAYALAVASDHGLWTRGERAEARALAEALPAAAWVRAAAGAGAQGPHWYEWACLLRPAGRTGCWCGAA